MTIEIIGRASVAPGASSVEELKQVLEQARCTVTRIPDERWDLARYWHPVQGTLGKTYTYAAGVIDSIYHFDPAVFGLSQREAMHMDPQQRMLLGLVWRALEDANVPPSSLSDERVGVYIGASSLDNGNLSVEDPSSGSPYFMTGNTLSIVSNRISHVFGLRGPSMTIDTACSSSLVALDQAARALERGEIDTAIVGGVNLLSHPLSFVGFAQARMLSPEGLCRAYDTNGHGYVRAEGGVAIVMRRTDRVMRDHDRSYARLHATGVNSAGRTNGISLPSREAQAALLKSIYEGHNIDVNRIAFIEGHGTGTRVGDPAEVWAIGKIIGKGRRAPVPIGSIKSNIGHTEPASGLFGLLKAMIALEHNFLPATLHIEQTNEDIDFEALNVRVNTATIELLPARAARFAGVNSFGFGGTNAHAVISDPDPVAPPEPQIKGDSPIFMVSAHSASALENLLRAYSSRLAGASPKEARQIVSSAVANRDGMRYRFAVKARDGAGVAAAIAAHLSGEASAGESGETVGQAARIAFVFSGNGSQWAGMGSDAYRENPHFRQCFQSFSALFEYYLGEKLTDLLFAEDLAGRLADTKVAQPLLFAIQAALSDTLVAQGVRPEAVFGHSVGEIAAAYAAKVLTAAEAVAIVAKRSQHQDLLAGAGKMAAVVLNEQAALAFARSNGFDDIVVAAINSPNSVTISGPSQQVQDYRDAARKAGIVAHVLDINYPFHHPIIDQAKDAFLADLPDIEPEVGNGTFISTVTGAALDGRRLDSGYWWQNVREPVLFRQAAEAAMDIGCNLFIEISPRPILSNYVTEIAKSTQHHAVAVATLLREPATGSDPVARAFARAVAHGVAPAKARGFAQRNAFLDLPPLPFEKVELRPQATSDVIDLFGRDGRSPYTLLGWRTDPNGSNWKNHVDAHLFPDLAEHVVDSKAIMPGAGFIEIAVTAAQQFYQSEHVEITNLEIIRPLELRRDRMAELSTVLSPETGDIEIRSRERLSNDDWTIHAFGRVRKFVGNTVPARAERVVGEMKSVLSAESTYTTAERFGLHYGPHFQLLSKAIAFAHGVVEVDLKPAWAPAHPYIAYNLNPMSVDSAFHGLVALFGEFSGDRAGAPYIPVRFGAVRVGGVAKPIAKARIELQRVNQNSLKARFAMFDADGVEVATLEDCRFRRTYLRRHHSLENVSLHYDTVPSALVPAKPRAAGAALMSAVEGAALNNATLLLDAAVYRACHELALMLADGGGIVTGEAMPGDAALRAFLTSCLFSLEDAGIAVAHGDGWRIPAEYTLPSLSEIVEELYREDASRVAEAVLVNNAYCDAKERLSAARGRAPFDDDALKAHATSEATLEHVLVHAPLSLQCLALAADAAGSVLEGAGGQIRHVLEAGSVSAAFSRRLAGLAVDNGAMLIIAEPRDNERRLLEIAFEHDVHVLVVHPDKLADQLSAGLVVAAGEESQSLLAGNEAIRAFAQRAAATGGILVFADRAASAFNDFVFGLSEGWFAASQSSAFPVGRLATADQISELAADLGFAGSAQDVATSAGTVLRLVAGGKPAVPAPLEAVEKSPSPLLVVAEGKKPIFAGVNTISLAADANRKAFETAVAKLSGQRVRLVYCAERSTGKDASARLQTRLQSFTALAETLAGDPAQTAGKPQIVIVAPGGSPVSALVDEANAGLWAFARVLQNEYDFLEVHVVDAAPSEPATVDLIDRILNGQTANREWMLDIKTGDLRELRAAGGPSPLSNRTSSNFSAASIRQMSAGRLDSIVWEANTPPAAGSGEVVVEVEATGLNFRDVMWAMGLLPEEALEDGFAGATIGMEFAGRITAVGEGVGDLAPGDKVMGIGPAAFSTHVRVRRDGVTKIPDRIDAVAAATVPVVFLTAYYAIVELGRVQAGETILIHGAAGGVGLAALQIAKMKGARVIATAGTVEKRRFLELLGADQVFDSRTLDFVSDVRRVTDGEGVDLVLNSLFDEAMERSLELVKPFGRFLELGKRDYYADRKIGLRPFRRNISYFGIDADQLLVNVPDLTRRIFSDMADLFAAGSLTPIPYRAFAFDEIGSAFRLMQNAGHIGKIVVRPPVSGRDKVLVQPGKPLVFDADGIFLVAGGIGGFGLEAAEWLVAKGARHIALCSRRGIADSDTKKALAAWQKAGVKASLHACDITDEAAVEATLSDLRKLGPIKGVVHAAMVLDDALMSNLTAERNKPVVDVKVKGADILHRLTAGDSLELFLLFSSATTMLGNPGQSNYVAANGYLEGLARVRRAAGLPGLAVGFGAIADKGYLARNAEVNEMLSKRIGKTALRAQDALDQVERYMLADSGAVDAGTVMIAEVDWNAARMLPVSGTSLFTTIMRQNGAHQSSGDSDTIDLEEMIRGKSDDEAQALLHKMVAAEIASILRITEEGITPDKVLKDIGLDSLMAMELGMNFQQKTGFDIPLSGIGEGTTVGDVVARLRERVANRSSTDQGEADSVVRQLVQSHSVAQQKAASEQ